MKVLLKLNQLFFGDNEVSNNDIVIYTVGATIGIIMVYFRLFN